MSRNSQFKGRTQNRVHLLNADTHRERWYNWVQIENLGDRSGNLGKEEEEVKGHNRMIQSERSTVYSSTFNEREGGSGG